METQKCEFFQKVGNQRNWILSVPREKKSPWLCQYQAYISNWYVNGKVFTNTTTWEPKIRFFFKKVWNWIWLVLKSWNQHSSRSHLYVDIGDASSPFEGRHLVPNLKSEFFAVAPIFCYSEKNSYFSMLIPNLQSVFGGHVQNSWVFRRGNFRFDVVHVCIVIMTLAPSSQFWRNSFDAFTEIRGMKWRFYQYR